MRVTLFPDLRFTTRPGATGVDKHVLRMARGLAAQPRIELSLLAAAGQANTHPALQSLPLRRLPLAWRTASALWTLLGVPCADRWVSGADWVYCPKNDWIPLRRTRYAVTIHGAPELDPALPPLPGLHGRLWSARNRIQYRRMCARADLILTVSEFQKAHTIEWFHADPERVVVIGNGVDDCFFAAGAAGPKTAAGDSLPYLLAVGGLNFLDGGDRILALAREIGRRRLDLRIQVAGCQHDPALAREASGLSAIELLGHLPAEGLAECMRGVAALYYPTRYETFGLAAVEAMAAGVPLVTCRSTAVPEIVGDAALYVEPDDPAQALDAIRSLQSDAGLREHLTGCGRRRAATFTWESCAARLARELKKRL